MPSLLRIRSYLSRLKRNIIPAEASSGSARSQKHIPRDWLLDAKSMLGEQPCGLMIDGGSYRGDVCERMARHFPSNQIHAFEPNGELFGRLASRFVGSDNVTCHHAAISSQSGESTFHVTSRPDCASLLPPGESAMRWHGDIMEVCREDLVTTVRLDDLFDNQDVALMKLDLQGHELDALRGSEELLRRTKIVVTEVAFIPLYEGQALFCDVAKQLGRHHFRLLHLSDVWIRPSGQLTQADAMFVNEVHFPLAER
ncbi:MAG: FkbM family methyltransferase [Planctomycetota bacterium]